MYCILLRQYIETANVADYNDSVPKWIVSGDVEGAAEVKEITSFGERKASK
jgi:hypothetical protein